MIKDIKETTISVIQKIEDSIERVNDYRNTNRIELYLESLRSFYLQLLVGEDNGYSKGLFKAMGGTLDGVLYEMRVVFNGVHARVGDQSNTLQEVITQSENLLTQIDSHH